MNSYILFNNQFQKVNDIPPRLMWNVIDGWSSSASGYCGETSILSAGLLYGQYIPMYLIRQLLADSFYSLWGDDNHTPSSELTSKWNNYYSDWSSAGSPGGDFHAHHVHGSGNFKEWFKNRGQYYCQTLLQIGDNTGDSSIGFDINEQLLKKLHLQLEQFNVKHQNTKHAFIPWIKKHVMQSYPVIIGVQDYLAGSNDPDYDHIAMVVGWGSNYDLSDTRYYPDDEIVLTDHGLVVGAHQPYGGAMPYYFKFVMETQDGIQATGGWLADGGCQDPANPAWNFIMDLGQDRTLDSEGIAKSNGQHSCNTYQLAHSPSQKSDGNAGMVIKGLSDDLPAGIEVRIQTNYFQIPVITAHDAKHGIMPSGQMMNHQIEVTGLDSGKHYNLWLFEACDTNEITQLPTNGFNRFGKAQKATCHPLFGVSSFSVTVQLEAHIALIARCVLKTDG